MYRTALSAIVLTLAAAACASQPSSNPSPSSQTLNTVLVGEDQSIQMSNIHGAIPVGADVNTALVPDSALAALRAAYEAASIPVTLFVPAEHRVGNPRLVIHGSLNHELLSRFINCGRTLTTSHADADQITMSIVSTIAPSPTGGSRVTTLLTATAMDRQSGNVSNVLPCSTTGVLESRLHRNAFGAM